MSDSNWRNNYRLFLSFCHLYYLLCIPVSAQVCQVSQLSHRTFWHQYEKIIFSVVYNNPEGLNIEIFQVLYFIHLNILQPEKKLFKCPCHLYGSIYHRMHLFCESVTHNMARLHFWRTDRVDKTKIKTKFRYQHTLLNIPNNGGLNCASDGI